ncbi:hypothetical protein EAI_14065, partial [Harpegnathos saltator]
GFLKDKVYRKKSTASGDMRARNTDVYQDITRTALEEIEPSFRVKVDQYIDGQGHPFEY